MRVFGGMLRRIVDTGERPQDRTPWQPTFARQAAWLGGLLAICFLSAGIGGALTATSVGGWYRTLAKPTWNPPDWVFGPVWTTLYALMAIAAWLVWRRDGFRAARGPLGWFAVQLGLNVAWSAIFFGLQRPGVAFAEILLLWLAIAATTIAFWQRASFAAWLFVPYWAWTTFAAVLNGTIWRLNS